MNRLNPPQLSSLTRKPEDAENKLRAVSLGQRVPNTTTYITKHMLEIGDKISDSSLLLFFVPQPEEGLRD